MKTHKWMSLLTGYEMTAIDVGLERNERNKKSIMRSIRNIMNRLVTPNSATSLMIGVALTTLKAHQVMS